MQRLVWCAALLSTCALTAGGTRQLAAAPDPDERAEFAAADQPAQYLGDRRYHLRHVRLDLAIDLRERSVKGTATNVLSPLLPGLSEVVLHAAGLAITQVRLVGEANDLAFSLDSVAQTLTVHLPHAFNPEDELALAVQYSAHPRAGLYFAAPDRAYPDRAWQAFSDGEPELNRYWFPTWDEPDERATTEVLATVERPFEVVSNGRLLGVTERPDGRRTFDWRMEQSHAAYLTSVVIGEFSHRSERWHEVALETYVPRPLASRAAAAFAHTADMMDFFSQWTGVPYPYAKYSQATVDDFMWGGMENISATTETTDTLRDDRAAVDSTSDDLVAHELAHQWFGDYVTCRSWAHSWLSEGMATYLEALYAQHRALRTGEDELAWRLDTYRQFYIDEDRREYRRPLVTKRYASAVRMFDAHTYDKGALVMHMLHTLVGDEPWHRAIHGYLTEHALATVVTQDFETALETASGIDLGPVFDEFVYGSGYPEVSLHWDYLPKDAAVHLELRQTQAGSQTGWFSFPVEVALLGENGSIDVRRVQMLAQPFQDLLLPAAGRPRTVVFDPRGVLLKTLAFDKPSSEWVAQLHASLPLASDLDAVRALAEIGDDEAVAALSDTLLHHRFAGVRQVAAAALEEIASGEALAALERAMRDPDPHVRSVVFASFGSFPENHELIAPLGRALNDDASYAVRSAAAAALGRFLAFRAEVTPLLTKALKQRSYLESVASAAIRALANLGAPETFSLAEAMARYGSPMAARADAMIALGRVAGQATDATQKQQARRLLESFLDDPAFNVRLRVPDALVELGDPAAIPALQRSLAAELQDEQRLPREKAIQRLQPQPAKPAAAEDLEQRLIQLQRSNEVLEERLRELLANRPAPPASVPPPH